MEGKTVNKRAGLAVAAMVAVALTGCSGDDPSAVPAGSSAAAVTESPGASPAPRRVPIPSSHRRFEPVTRITGALTPKSVVASSKGFVVAQNMIYTHTVSVYNRKHELVTTLSDEVTPSDFGYPKWPSPIRGGPVEASFTPDGSHVWISNYSMYGPGFSKEGHDTCSPSSGFDRSFVYRVDTRTWAVDGIVAAGVVPKFIEVTPDGKHVLVTNWCTYDLTVIDTATMRAVNTVPIGRYPRGIAISPDSTRAYVAVMGGTEVKSVDLTRAIAGAGTGVVKTLSTPGSAPRHLNLSPTGRFLYVTLNGAGTVAKVDTRTGTVLKTVRTGKAPRSAALSPDGSALFVVNYDSGTVSRVRTADMKVLESRTVDHHPIGVTYNPISKEIWVCSYIGAINVFKDAVQTSR